MAASIGFGWVNRWRERVLDQVAEKAVQKLRCAQAHAVTRGDLGNPVIVRVDDPGRKGQVHNAVDMSGLCNQVDKLNRLAGVPNLPPVTAYRQLPATAYHNFIV